MCYMEKNLNEYCCPVCKCHEVISTEVVSDDGDKFKCSEFLMVAAGAYTGSYLENGAPYVVICSKCGVVYKPEGVIK